MYIPSYKQQVDCQKYAMRHPHFVWVSRLILSSVSVSVFIQLKEKDALNPVCWSLASLLVSLLSPLFVAGDEKGAGPAVAGGAAAVKPLSRSQKVENLQECVDALERRGVDTHGVTASGE